MGIFKVLLGGIFEAENHDEANEKARNPENNSKLTTLRVFQVPDEQYDPRLEMMKNDIDKLLLFEDEIFADIDPNPEAMKIWRKNIDKPSMILEAKLKDRDDLVALIYVTETYDNPNKVTATVININPKLIESEINWLIKSEYEQK